MYGVLAMELEELKLDTPAVYTIRIVGMLDEKWSDRLGGMSVTTTSDQDKQTTVTMLTGRLADQAALLGVLNTLYDYRYPLLSVECLSST
jgi:hypothetical protein